jgi:DNA repair protein RadD
MTIPQLHPFQLKIESQIANEYNRGFSKQLIQSPTGSGKTFMAASLIRDFYYNSEKTVVFTVGRVELVDQMSKTLDLFGVPHATIKSGKPWNFSERVQIASIETLINNFWSWNKFEVVMVDECHHLPAPSWDKLFLQYEDSHFFGFTATPLRLDGKSLEPYFETMIMGPSVKELIDDGFLANCNIEVIDLDLNFDKCRVGKISREYNLVDLRQAFAQFPDTPTKVVEYYHKRFNGDSPKTIAFCHDIESSKALVNEFILQGFNAAHIDGMTNKTIREDTIKEFRNGTIDIISNVELFGEGFDVPDVDVTILLRPTRSLTLSLQQIGRGMRKSSKDLTILDFVGNTCRLGSPLENRDWSFDSELHLIHGATVYLNKTLNIVTRQLRRVKNCDSSLFKGEMDKDKMETTYKQLINFIKYKQVKICANPDEVTHVHNYSATCNQCGWNYKGRKPAQDAIVADETIDEFYTALTEFQLL